MIAALLGPICGFIVRAILDWLEEKRNEKRAQEQRSRLEEAVFQQEIANRAARASAARRVILAGGVPDGPK